MLTSVKQAEAAFLAFAPQVQKGAHTPYTLDTITKLVAYAGNPHNQLKVIHVAGTSGKTSTSYFIRALLQQSGQKTGLTVSPHITSIKERVQIDGDMLPDEAYVRYASEFLDLVDKSGLKPSFFEAMMAFAYWVFAKEKVDYAVVETGMGGLLDGSNIARRSDKIAAITDIGLDHTEILGETLPEIALQKAGIIHEGNEAFIIDQPREVLDEVAGYAKLRHAPLHIVSPKDEPFLPSYQQRNWSIARSIYRYLTKRDGLPGLNDEQLRAAMAQMPPGRLEEFHIGGKTVIFDGAHNPQKLKALAQVLADRGIEKTTVLASFIKAPANKTVSNVQALAEFTSHLIVPEFTVVQDIHKQSPQAEIIATEAQKHVAKITVQKDVTQALELLLKAPEPMVVVTGSLYLVSQVRALLVKML